MYECFLDKVSSKFEEPTVCEIVFIMTEDPQLSGSSALEGVTLMEFMGKKSENDLGLPKY